MSSYWDTASREIAGSETVDEAKGIEERVIDEVLQVTGDREFPDDHRTEILGIIAVRRIDPIGGDSKNRSREWFQSSQISRMIEDLHDAFHELARPRHETRFGPLSDNVNSNLFRRDAHTVETGE